MTLALNQYSRSDLSNLLQIAQQAYNDGYPLPCCVVEQIVEAHDNLLSEEQRIGPHVTARAENHTETKHRKKIQVGAISGKSCGRHPNTLLHRAECGKIFCPDCMDEGRV